MQHGCCASSLPVPGMLNAWSSKFLLRQICFGVELLLPGHRCMTCCLSSWKMLLLAEGMMQRLECCLAMLTASRLWGPCSALSLGQTAIRQTLLCHGLIHCLPIREFCQVSVAANNLSFTLLAVVVNWVFGRCLGQMLMCFHQISFIMVRLV